MNKTKKLVMAAMFAVVTFVVTFVIMIPSPFKGYINLGDAPVIISGLVLQYPYAFLAAAVGSALSDVCAGYVVYAPVTFLIKGIMGMVVSILYRRFKNGKVLTVVLLGIVAEIIMVLGYIIYESFLYGFMPALMNSVPNLIQGTASLIVATVFFKILSNKLK